MATHHTSSGFQMSPWVERKSDGGAPLLLVLLHVISRFPSHTCVLFHHDLAGTHENWPIKHKPKVLNGWPSGTIFRCWCLNAVQFKMVSMRFEMWYQFGSRTCFLLLLFFFWGGCRHVCKTGTLCCYFWLTKTCEIWLVDLGMFTRCVHCWCYFWLTYILHYHQVEENYSVLDAKSLEWVIVLQELASIELEE